MLSLLVALTGILLPIALSFLLIPLGASPLQCFSAGASLSATSLGTAFATLSSSGLLNTEVGTVLTSAAMLDDVVGLVMLQVVTGLSTGQGTASDFGKTIGRALGTSVGLVLIVVLVCRLILRPLYRPVTSWLWSPERSHLVKRAVGGVYFPLVTHTALLLILVVSGSYAGTSALLAAFVAGVMVRWWGDAVVPNKDVHKAPNDEPGHPEANAAVRRTPHTGLQIYERFYSLSTEQILKPFFFASIGFSMPITQMFHATTVWKGLVYALMMFLAKTATGLWLVPRCLQPTPEQRPSFSISGLWKRQTERILSRGPRTGISPSSVEVKTSNAKTVTGSIPDPSNNARVVSQSPRTQENLTVADITAPAVPADTVPSALDAAPIGENSPSAAPPQPNPEPKPEPESEPHRHDRPIRSPPMPTAVPCPSPSTPPERRALRAYSPALLGLAMAARGEIGFLIASVAASHGIFSSSSASSHASASVPGTGDELYLVVVWAIVLCTIAGPVAVGGLVRRIKRLEAQG
ncbi:Sodium/hydrogen exchanger family-domain-containing protein [Gautieria morchelliformis]|nr:Sodium/hydrogen exchanger family-domain-containing protein [Gautieria morchelliformis]